MKLKLIGCKVLLREVYCLAARCKNTVDTLWLEQALHLEPEKLRRRLQEAILRVENETEQYDAILLGYGLCSNGIVGIKSEKTPLVVPRAHDCITLLLGSKERYRREFDARSGGIYWYSPGWIEHSLQPGKERYEKAYREYAEKYGEDNAAYLMEMEQNWMKEYKCAVYVDWPELACPEHVAYTRECADFLNWQCEILKGDSGLMRRMLDGEWGQEDFLIMPPGQVIAPTYREDIISAAPPGAPRNPNEPKEEHTINR